MQSDDAILERILLEKRQSGCMELVLKIVKQPNLSHFLDGSGWINMAVVKSPIIEL